MYSSNSSCGYAFAIIVEVFDVGPSRFKSHPRATFYYFLFTRHEDGLGSG